MGGDLPTRKALEEIKPCRPMNSPLDKLEVITGLKDDPDFNIEAIIHCSRTKFEALCEEIKEEYDLSVVEDVAISQERIENQLSNIYGVMLHGVRYLFHIKD